MSAISPTNSSTINSRQWKEKRLTLLNEKQRRRASTSLYEFVAQAWHVVEPVAPFKDNWHIGAIAEHLMAVSYGQIRRLVINVPPRTAKSTVCGVMWPAWEWIHWPAHKWLCGSHKLSLATRDGLAMRRLIQSQWYRERWGREFNLVDNSDWGDPRGFELTKDQNQKIRFENDRSGRRIAFGFESGITGDGGGRILVDDPHDTKQAHSDAERENGVLTFREGISTRLDDPGKDPIVIVMQRLNENDLSGYALSIGYEHLLIPMHYDPARSNVTVIGWKDPRTQAGELLDEQRFPVEVVAELETHLGTAASGQLEQRPAPATGEIFNPAWWQFYDEEPTEYDMECQSWDMAFKGTKTSNFVAGQAWGRKGANCYYKPDPEGGVYKQIDFTLTREEFRAFSKVHPDASKLVEDKANGPAIIASLKDEIPGILPINNPEGGAVGVARAVAPYVKAGNVWLPNPYTVKVEDLKRNEAGVVMPGTPVNPERRWVLRFIQNATTFPNGSIPAGSHGDDIVAGTQAINYLMHNKPSKVWIA